MLNTNSAKQHKKNNNASYNVRHGSSLLDGDFLQDELLLDLGAATLNLEIVQRRYSDPEGSAVAVQDACTTVTATIRKTVTVEGFLARGRRLKTGTPTGRKPKTVLTGC